MKTLRCILIALALTALSPAVLLSQNKGSRNLNTGETYPTSFVISKSDLFKLIGMRENEVIKDKDNKYLDGGIVVKKSASGDMSYTRVKLAYFRKAHLNIQVNGINSTQVFITSEDKSVFYKGSVETENVIMLKCDEDEIISE